jgi:hypothetical protein
MHARSLSGRHNAPTCHCEKRSDEAIPRPFEQEFASSLRFSQ